MKIQFEIGECGRCGGSGKFSFNGEHDRCYGCNGQGTALTSKGKRARAAYDALMKERCTRFVDEIKENDVIYQPRSFDRKAGWYRVESVFIDPLNPKYPGFKFTNGKSVRYNYRGEVLVQDLDAIKEIAQEVASRFKGAILIED